MAAIKERARELPGGYDWGIAKASRHRVKPPMHLVYPGGAAQMVCSGGPALVENSGGHYCRECLAWLDEYDDEYGQS